MPIIQPPPYQDRQDTQRWAEWFRLINERLSNISLSIDAIDDVDITVPVNDGQILVASGGVWGNSDDWTMASGAQIFAPDGTGAAPSYTFASDTDAGMWLLAAGALRISVANTGGLRISSGQVRTENAGSAAVPALAVGSETDTGFFEPANDEIAVSCATTEVMHWLASEVQCNVDFDLQSNDLVMNDSTFIKDDTGDEYLQFVTAGGATHYFRIRQGSSTTGLELSMQSSAHVADGHLKILHAGAPTNDAGIMLGDINSDPALLARFVASPVNYLQVTNSATTDPLDITAIGTDTDIDIDIQPKGAGVVRSDRQVSGPTTSVTAATHNMADGDRYLLCDTSSNAITVNLLAAATAGDGYRVDIKLVDATNSVTVDGSTTETIDGSLTKTITTLYDNMSLVCDGSNWHIL